MDGKAYFLTLANYHRWAYKRLADCLRPLDDENYRADHGLFFKSIHRTLNHLLLVDRLWFARFHGRTLATTDLAEELVKERDRLVRELDDQARHIIEFVTHLPEERLQENLRYRNTKGEELEFAFAPLLAHVFNHGTHHRGQISAAMTRLGLDAPVLDVPYFLIDLRDRGEND